MSQRSTFSQDQADSLDTHATSAAIFK